MKLSNFYFSFFLLIFTNVSALALPPTDDIPEEILATEIIIEGISSLDSQRLTAKEYAEEREREEEPIFSPEIDSEIKHNIFLLQILKILRMVNPIN